MVQEEKLAIPSATFSSFEYLSPAAAHSAWVKCCCARGLEELPTNRSPRTRITQAGSPKIGGRSKVQDPGQQLTLHTMPSPNTTQLSINWRSKDQKSASMDCIPPPQSVARAIVSGTMTEKNSPTRKWQWGSQLPSLVKSELVGSSIYKCERF